MTPPSSGETIFLATLASGALEQVIRTQHGRWAFFLPLDEFLQEAATHAWTQREKFEGASEAAFLAWFARLARNRAIDLYRKHERRQNLVQEVAREIVEVVMPATESLSAQEYVAWLLAGLSELEQAVVRGFHLEELSAQELADRLGYSRATVYQLLRSARNKLERRREKDDKSS